MIKCKKYILITLLLILTSCISLFNKKEVVIDTYCFWGVSEIVTKKEKEMLSKISKMNIELYESIYKDCDEL
jgi:hypothetical protein